MRDTIGNLVFDSWIALLPELRSSSQVDHHLIYEGGGIVLDLLLKRAETGARIQIDGQVMPGDETPMNVKCLAVVMENGNNRWHTSTNALGEFSFQTATADGCYELSIALDDRRFLVRGLEHAMPGDWQVVAS